MLAEDLLELDWYRSGQLVEGAGLGWFVGAPAQERGAVAEAAGAEPAVVTAGFELALPVIEGDLANQIRSDGQPFGGFLAVAPAALT